MFINRKFKMIYSILMALLIALSCTKNEVIVDDKPIPTPVQNEVDVWYTSANQTMLLQKQSTKLSFSTATNNYTNIDVDSTVGFQTIDGFGYTLTGGSAKLISGMGSSQRDNLLHELFSCSEESICISYLRLSIGASDLDEAVFSYNDLEAGKEDLTLSKFNLAYDTLYLLPILKSILKINPDIKLMGSPWSPPTWMKDNKKSIGGSLMPKYYGVYADYFVKYITSMREHGIKIDAITIQNEPQHGGNNPSLVMSASEQADFIKNHLGPKFKAANIATKIIIWDHNCDNPNYPISILNDADAKSYIDGSAFHLYNGNISALSTVHNAHPDKNLYFTEQWTGSNGSFDGDLKWHINNVVIGSVRNWSKVALEWNLANDPSFNPHTPGGCTQCKGALTIDQSIVNRNVGYYIIAHASKFVPAGSIRIHSSLPSNLPNAAFLTPSGKKVLIVLNESNGTELFNIHYKDKKALTHLPAGTVGTFVW